MKFTLILLWLVMGLASKGKTQNEIELSKNIPEVRLAVWAQGDYIIKVNPDDITTFLNMTIQNFENDILRCSEKDSILVNYYRSTSNRYQTAADQLENASNGFDLRTLIVYNGIEDVNQNIGNSWVVQGQIKNLVEKGTAIVTYKGERIFTLKCQTEMKEESGLLNSGYLIRTYFDDVENCIFSEYIHMGW